MIIIFFYLLNNFLGRVKETSPGEDSLRTQNICYYTQLLKRSRVAPFLCVLCSPYLFRINEYFEKSEFDYSRFYCIAKLVFGWL